MADRQSSFTIGVGGDDGDLKSLFSALKSRMRSDVAELESITRNVKLFEGLEDRTKAAAEAMLKARDAAQKLATQVQQAEQFGGKASAELVASLKEAERELKTTTAEYNRATDALSKMQTTLSKAGVDTRNLATEQARLAEATRAAAAAALDQSNKNTLGLKTFRDTQVEANKLLTAYNALKDGGKLSFGELSIAQARLQQGLTALRTDTVGIGAAFTEVRGRIIAFAAAFAGIAAAVKESATNYRAFAQQVAAVDSIAGVSKQRLAELTAGVRELSRRLGVDAVQSTQALYDIISSGIPPENALTVLEQATKAAIAGITDVGTAARVGVSVLNSYNLEISQLPHVYDVLFQTVKDGVVTFPQLAGAIGSVLPVAKAARVPIEEVGAAFVVMTQRGIDAAEAGTSIASAIKALSAPTPEAAQRINDLGLELKGFAGTIEQIAAKKLSLSIITDIVPDVRAQRAILTLAGNFEQLSAEINAAARAAGTMQEAYAKMAATPQARVDRFNAAIKDLSLSVGEFVTGSSSFVQSLTSIVNAFNDLDARTKSTILNFAAMTVGLTAAVLLVRTLAVPINLLAGALAAAGTAGIGAAGGITAASLAVNGLQLAIAGFLGFQFGKQLYDNFAPVRLVGDLLGIIAGRIDNLATFAFEKLRAAVTLNGAAFAEASVKYQRNAAILDQDWANAVSGATERSRQLADAQALAATQFGRASTAAKDAAASLGADLTKALAAVKGQIDASDASVTKIEQRLGQLVANLQQAVSQTQQAAQQAIAEVNASEQQQLAALATLQTSIADQQKAEIANIRATVDIQAKAAADRLAILQKFAIDVRAAFETEAKARLEIAKASGENVKKIEQELALARRTLLQQVVDAFRAHVAQLENEYKGHLDRIKTLEATRVANNQLVADKILSIQRQGLTAYEQYVSRVNEIDDLLAKSRLAAQKGNLQQAEDFAKRAIALTDTISGEVKEDGGIIIDAISASRNATDRLTEAGKLLNIVIDKRVEAEKQGAAETKNALEAAQRQLADLSTQLTKAQDIAAAGIKLQITSNVAEVKTQIDALTAAIAEREHLLKIKVDLEDARNALKALQEDLDKGVTVNLTARTDLIEAALAKVSASAPPIDLDVKPALTAIESIRRALESLSNVKLRIDAAVGTDPIATPRALGGPIGDVPLRTPQRYAGGGVVFRRPSWDKVPGTGDGDTVPAALPSGSFVIRKSASQYYGDSIMSRFAGAAQRFAVGGSVNHIGDIASRILGGSSGNLVARLLGLGGGGELSELKSKAVREISPLIDDTKGLPRSISEDNLGDFLSRLLEMIVTSNDLPAAQKLLSMFEEMAEQWRSDISIANEFRVPAVIRGGLAKIFDSAGFSEAFLKQSAKLVNRKFATGGSVGDTDTVPALLTPGEYVLKPSAVSVALRRFGGGFLDALNQMRIPREAFAGFSAAPPAPPPLRFAGGGMVPGGASVAAGGSGGLGGITININGAQIDWRNPDSVRRGLLPVIRDIQRRASS